MPDNNNYYMHTYIVHERKKQLSVFIIRVGSHKTISHRRL